VAIGNAGLAVRIEIEASTGKPLKTFLNRYFYLCMSLVLAALVILGFGRTVNTSLFHANPPRPLLLWIHGAAFSTWIHLSLARRHGVVVHRAADLATGGADPQSVQDLLRGKRVRLLAVTWVPTNSGLMQPVEALGQIAEASGVPYVVDACQAIGQIPIDIFKLKCDFLSATARKFLRGPRGIGLLYVSDRALKRGDFPLYIDMRGADWISADIFQPAPDARRFENWEFPYSLVLGLGEAARNALAVGIERGGGRARQLAAELRDKLKAVPGIRVLDRGNQLAAIVTIEVAGWNATELSKLLRKRSINTSASLRAYAVIDMDEKRAASALASPRIITIRKTSSPP
jgi:selenocysteine lyase/cysteine desulfurase